MNIEELRRNAQAAPHEVLQSASFVLAFGGEGAAAYVVHGGWSELLDRFARETIGHPAADMAMRTHPNHSEWMTWLEALHDLDEWATDESSDPYSFDSEVGEISTVTIYRLSSDASDGAVASWKKAASAVIAHWKKNGPTVEAQWCTDAAHLLAMGNEMLGGTSRE